MATFGDRFKELRKSRQLTQEQIAKIFFLNKSSISRYEQNRQMPEISLLQKFAEFFDVSIDFLLGNTDNPTPADKITQSVSDDPELAEFWNELKEREDLKLLFKQTRTMPPNDIKKIIRIIKAIEDEEATDDSL